MPNKAFFEKVGMFKAKSKELTFPVDQKRGAGQSKSASQSMEGWGLASRMPRRRVASPRDLRMKGSSGIPRNEELNAAAVGLM